MTVANGSAILAADLAALTTTQLGLVQADNAALPGALALHFYFQNLLATTPAYESKTTFVVPADFYLDAIAVEANNHTAASTTTVTVQSSANSGDASGTLGLWPATITGTTGAGTTKLSRLLYDGSLTPPKRNFATGSRAFRTYNKGNTLQMTVTTTNTTTASWVHVILVARSFYARG